MEVFSDALLADFVVVALAALIDTPAVAEICTSGALAGFAAMALVDGKIGMPDSTDWLWERISAAPMPSTTTAITATTVHNVLLLTEIWRGETDVFMTEIL
jgi:hypothetical protein